MKLGIVQEKADDPNTLKIVNQETGEPLQNVLDYCVTQYAGDSQKLNVTVLIPLKSCE